MTAGHDHTCRVWKVPEESQLIFRSHAPAVDCVRYITGTQWVSGASDGSLAVWSQMKKRPVSVIRGAHASPSNGAAAAGAGSVGGDAASWVQSVTVCHGSDLVVLLLRHPFYPLFIALLTPLSMSYSKVNLLLSLALIL